MKKGWMIALLAVSALALTGCGGKEEANDNPAADASEAEEITGDEEADAKKDAPQIEIASGQNMDWYSEDGSSWLLHAEYEEVSVEGEGYENAAAAVGAWSDEQVERLRAQGEESSRLAEEDEALTESDYYQYSIFHELKTARADSRVISLVDSYSEYMGGAHGNYGDSGVNFDAVSGQRLRLGDILKDEEGFRAEAADYITQKLEQEYGEGLFPDYEDTVGQLLNREEDSFWYFTGAGITIILNPYEVGPYAMGKAEVTLPYSQFSQYMEETYTDISMPGVARIPEGEQTIFTDSSGNERMISIGLEEPEEYEPGELYAEVDGTRVDMEPETFSRLADIYLLKMENGRDFVVLDADYMSDDFVTISYEVGDGTLAERGRLNGVTINGGTVNTKGLQLQKRMDVLGSYYGRMRYTLDESGGFKQQDTYFEILDDNSPYRTLVTVKELPVRLGEEDTVLPVGSRIRITATDDEETAFFRNEDTDEEGSIRYTRGNGSDDTWTIYIDGVPDHEYFELLPYAG